MTKKTLTENLVPHYWQYHCGNALGSNVFGYRDAIKALAKLRATTFKECPEMLIIAKSNIHETEFFLVCEYMNQDGTPRPSNILFNYK